MTTLLTVMSSYRRGGVLYFFIFYVYIFPCSCWRPSLVYFWILGHKRIRFHDLPQAWRLLFPSDASLIPGWSGSSPSLLIINSLLRTPKPSKTMDSPDREDQKKSLIDLNNRYHAFISESPLNNAHILWKRTLFYWCLKGWWAMWRRWGSCRRLRTWSTAFLARLKRQYFSFDFFCAFT